MGENRIFKISGKCQRDGYWDGGCSGESFSGKILVENGIVKGFCDKMNGFFTVKEPTNKRYLYGITKAIKDGEGIAFLGLENNIYGVSYVFINPNINSPKNGVWKALSLMNGKIGSLNLGQTQIDFIEEPYSEDEEKKILEEYGHLDKKANEKMIGLNLEPYLIRATTGTRA